MIAGPNGSGKSTLKARLEARGADFGVYFNADDIARTLDGDAESVARDAQQIVRDGREAALQDGRDYSWETVMSHPSHIEHLRAARALGYTTRLFYVATDSPLTNIGRVVDRVARGGHDVPPDRVIQRYAKSLGLLVDAFDASDAVRIFDNSDPDRAFRLLLRRDDGGAWHLTTDDLPRWFSPVAASLAERLGA